MIDIVTSPGVLGFSTRSYVVIRDVEKLCGCAKTKAADYIIKVNQYVEKDGGLPMPPGKANKLVFSKLLQLPIELINETIAETDRELTEIKSEAAKKAAETKRRAKGG